ncbi:MAG: hypothetical protein Salg2KO_08360 [Salibacteraceae bacterium]
MKAAAVLFILVLLSSGLRSQIERFDESQFLEAKEAIEVGDFLAGYEMLRPLCERNPNWAEAHYACGICAWEIPKYMSTARSYIEKAVNLGFAKAHLKYAQILLTLGDPYQALVYAGKVEDRSDSNKVTRALIERQCLNAIKAMEMAGPMQVTRMGESINSIYAEHTPLISGDESVLYFTSRRPMNESSVLGFSGQYDENIYYSRSLAPNWDVAQPINGSVNGLLNEATAAIGFDAREMLVFRTSHDLESSDIWLAVEHENKWKWKSRLGKSINSDFIEQSATWTSDKNVFYFSSNRPGGYGGFDLYRTVQFANGEFSLPQNLGPSINTEFDEISPYLLADDRTLYFSSNGLKSIGGFDFFRSNRIGDTLWSEPENLGYPLNSTGDDYQITVSWQGGDVYFSRGKEEDIGDLDIYKSRLPGFNLSANVYKMVIADYMPEIEYEITLWSEDFSETLGYFYPNDRGEFIVVMMPSEVALLEVLAPDFQTVEIPLNYIPGEGVQEFSETIYLKETGQ